MKLLPKVINNPIEMCVNASSKQYVSMNEFINTMKK